jgi:transcriptional regulator with XRE-family HTH domain
VSESNYRATFNRQRLKTLRKARGLSQKRLGNAANVQQKTIYNIEKGATEPYNGTVDAIAKALGVRREYFYEED